MKVYLLGSLNLLVLSLLIGWSFGAETATAPSALPNEIDSYPTLTLSNGVVEAKILLPDVEHGYYRGARFDWAGLIAGVKYRGHTFFGRWKTGSHDPQAADDAPGPAEEFGMISPPGFADAAAGEPFIKIGVGELLRGDAQAYRFNKRYLIVDSPKWTVTRGDDFVEFRQELKNARGWGYDYGKRVSLSKDEPEIIIEHHLTNTGRKTLATDEYCHNFIIIDGHDVDEAYDVKLPFDATVQGPSTLGDKAVVNGKRIKMLGRANDNPGLRAELGGLHGHASDYGFTVESQLTGGAVSVSGDIAPSKMVFYACAKAICIEPFIQVKLNPSEQISWTTRYRFAGPAMN